MESEAIGTAKNPKNSYKENSIKLQGRARAEKRARRAEREQEKFKEKLIHIAANQVELDGGRFLRIQVLTSSAAFYDTSYFPAFTLLCFLVFLFGISIGIPLAVYSGESKESDIFILPDALRYGSILFIMLSVRWQPLNMNKCYVRRCFNSTLKCFYGM